MLRNNEAQRASLLQNLSPVISWDIFFNEAFASLKKSHAVNGVNRPPSLPREATPVAHLCSEHSQTHHGALLAWRGFSE